MSDELARGQSTELSDNDRMSVKSVFDQHGDHPQRLVALGRHFQRGRRGLRNLLDGLVMEVEQH
jgi:hypothetical protein